MGTADTDLATSLATDLGTNLAATAGAPSLTPLGSKLRHWFETPASSSPLIVLESGRVRNLYDKRETDFVTPTYDYLEQTTAANQPLYNATGGPLNRPNIELDSTARRLPGTLTTMAAGNRVEIFAVLQHPTGAAGDFHSFQVNDAGTIGVVWYANNTAFKIYGDFNLGTDMNTPLSAPTFDTDWHCHAFRPISGGPLLQIDGATTTPNITNTNGLRQLSQLCIGHVSSSASRGVFGACFITDPLSADEYTNVVVPYLSAYADCGI